jgi:hypothetical protein
MRWKPNVIGRDLGKAFDLSYSLDNFDLRRNNVLFFIYSWGGCDMIALNVDDKLIVIGF